MSESHQLGRETLPIPDPAHTGLTTYDCQGPGNLLPADRAVCGRHPVPRTWWWCSAIPARL